MECIVLAGGLGTRLRGVIGEMPKCMAPVNGAPFLSYLFRYLETQGCTRVVLSLGHLHETVEEWYKSRTWPFAIDHVLEATPLGTGGGIRLALEACHEHHCLVLNGDTLFQISLPELMALHSQKEADATLALKPMRQFNRYGVVRIDAQQRITGFEEKKQQEEGLINGGVYAIHRASFLSRPWPDRFSFEKDYLEPAVGSGELYGFVSDAYFLDIGIPEDYEQSQTDFKAMFE